MANQTARRTVRAITESNLSRGDKLRALRQLERDLAARSVAAEEGMAPTPHTPVDDIGKVREARRQLRDPQLERRRSTSTKYGG